MTTAELRRKVKRDLDELSEPKLRTVADIISYLRDRESSEATNELLQIPGFLEDFNQGVKDIAAGRTIDWRKVRKDV